MILAVIVSVLIICLTLIVKRHYQYWEKHGISYLQPKFPYGNIKSVLKKEKAFGVAIYDLYKESDQPMVGIFLLFRRALLIRDKNIVKNILTNDFESFHDRGLYINAKHDPISANLFTLPGEQWRSLRNKVTPAFTSVKLKGMFPHIKFVAETLVKYLEPLAQKGETIEIFEYTHRFVVDCLASVAFGQEGISTINEPNHDFARIPKMGNNQSFSTAIRNAGFLAFPELMKILRITGQIREVREFFFKLTEETIEERERNNIIRKDLMQYLIKIRNDNLKSDDVDDEWKISKKSVKSMTHEEIASEVFVFQVAGQEGSASTIGYILFELTRNESLMKRAKEDIKLTLEKHEGNITYESVMDMKFIDLCVKESLRKYPTLAMINRECTKDYHVSGTDITIEKGTSIFVSLMGMHNDENYFPNPEKYNPDRFSEEIHDYDEDAYMPFGIGPRNCLGYGSNVMKFNKSSFALIPDNGEGKMMITKNIK